MNEDSARAWALLSERERLSLGLILEAGASIAGRCADKVTVITRDIGGIPVTCGVACGDVRVTFADDDIAAGIARLRALAEVPVVRG